MSKRSQTFDRTSLYYSKILISYKYIAIVKEIIGAHSNLGLKVWPFKMKEKR